MSEIPTIPPIVNRTMKFVLRSPMHGLVDKQILLITFTGRKSGKTYTTPVSYSQSGDQVVIFTHADWWKNLRGDAPVSVHIRGQELQGLAEHLRKVRSDAKYYGVTFDADGNPRSEEVEKAAQAAVMIRIKLC